MVRANDAAVALVAMVGPAAMEDGLNVYRLSLHPEGLVARSPNPHEWVPPLVAQLRRSVRTGADAVLTELLDEVMAYPATAAFVDDPGPTPEPAVVVPFRLTADGGELSLFTTLTTFGTATDITFAELAIELFFPEDDATEQLLRA